MAIQLGSAYGKVGIDGSGVKKGVGEATGTLDGFKSKMEDIGGKMQSIGTKMSLALTLPILAASKKMVESASNLEETKNKVAVLFGDMSDEMLAWSQNSATAFGQSQQAALDGAATFATFGSAADLAGEDLANFATQNTELASDLASFFNTSPEEAITAIGAAFRGETEPIRQYGVMLNQASIEAKALEMGLIPVTQNSIEIREAQLKATDAQEAYDKALQQYGDDSEQAAKAGLAHAKAQQALEEAMAGNVGEMSQQAKILAVQALIMEQTTAAQGDFARTSDGLANQQRILKAELENSAAALGQQLLPYVLKGVNLLRMLLQRFQGLSPQMQKTILVILAVVAAIGPLLMVLGSIVTAIGTIAPIIGAVGAAISGVALPILAIIALIALLFVAWKNNWGGIQEKTAAAIGAIKGWWEGTLLPALQKVWSWMNSVLFPYFKALANFLSAVFGVAVKALAGIWQNVLYPAIQKAILWMKANVVPVLQPIANFLKNTLAKAFDWVSTAIKNVTSWLNELANKLANMSLPSWMTPGSPTPWEIGLRGVNAQLKALSRARLPELQLGMNRLPMPAVANSGFSGNMAAQQEWNQRVMIYNASFNSPGDMRQGNWLRRFEG